MKKNVKIIILSIVIIVASFILIRQGIKLNRGIKDVKMPNRENRQFGNMSTYKWITVRKISQRYRMSISDTFKEFGITPEPGDEDMPINELGKKYKKPPEEIRKDLMKITKEHKSVKGKRI